MDKERTKYLFIGDVHGDFTALRELVSNSMWANYMIQVGDLALYDKPIKKTIKSPRPIYFIKGNHDDYSSLESEFYQQNNYFYLKQGEVKTLGKINIGCLGGVYSSKRSYFKTKELKGNKRRFYTTEEIEKLKNQSDQHNIDILVTHEAPSGGILRKGNSKREEGSDLIKDLMDYVKPTFLIHGHHHYNYEKQAPNGTRVIGVGNMQTNKNSYRIVTW